MKRRLLLSLFSLALLLLGAVGGLTLTSNAQSTVSAHAASAQNQSLAGFQHYLSLGDSLSFGYQPNNDVTHGYNVDLLAALKQASPDIDLKPLGCNGENSVTFINGGCPAKTSDVPQLTQAVSYLQQHKSERTLITLSIGANDILFGTNGNPPSVNVQNCTANDQQFNADINALDANLQGTILPQLQQAATDANGQMNAKIVLVGYYDPFQNNCPNQIPYIQTLNTHLTNDVQNFGTFVDVFPAFNTSAVPNQRLCSLTWICGNFQDAKNQPIHDFHPTTQGYQVIACTILRTLCRQDGNARH